MSKIEKVISISLDDKTKNGLGTIEKTLDGVDKSMDKAAKTSENLKVQLRELQKDLLSGKFTGKEFDEATAKAGGLKDTIADLNARVKVLGSDTKNIDGLISAAQGLAGGFAIAQGAAGLLGGENEDLQKSLLKVQSSMAILNGIQSVANVLQSESAASILILGSAQKAYNIIVGESTGALKIFKLALAATGIGLLVIALAELVANWDKVSEAITGTNQKMKDIKSVTKDVNKELTDVYDNLYTVKSAFDQAARGAISKKDALKIYNDTLGDTLGKAKTLEQAEKLYAEKTPDYIKASLLRAQSQALIAKAAEEAIKVATGEAGDVGFLDKLSNIWKGYTTGQYLSLKEVSENQIKETEKRKDRFLKLAAETQAAADDISKKAGLDFIPDEKVTEQKDEKIKPPSIVPYEDISTETETILSGLDARNQAIRDKDAKFKEDTLAAEQQFQLENAQIIYDSDTAIAERKKEERDREIQDFKDKTEAISIVAQSGENLLASIQANGIARGKAGQAAMKALALVQIGADSAIAFSKMMQGTEASAAGAASVAGPAAPAVYTATKIAFYASGTATILANIARARALLKGGGDSGGGGGQTPVPATPPQAQFNIVGQSSTNQLAETIANKQQQPVKAYVVGSEVTTQQSLDRSKINNATFL